MSITLESTFDLLGIHDPAERQRISDLLKRAGVLADAPPPALALFDPADIETDPTTYQFRSGSDAKSGVTPSRRYHTDHWDPILHGDPLLLHERLDGRIFVADGHHRLQLAQRLNAQGRGPGRIAAQLLREADGYTAQDAKIIAAYKNIQHGQTDTVDTARVFKEAESGAVHAELLPQLDMNKGNLTLAYRLSKLSDPALDMVARGEVPAALAAQVPGHTTDPLLQESAMRLISARLRPKETALPGFRAKLQQERAMPPSQEL